MNLEQILTTALGLTDSEAKTYQTLADFGELSVEQVSKKSSIKRTLVYHTTRKLVEMGIISEFEKRKRKYFRINNPETLEKMVNDKRENIATLTNIFSEQTLPELSKKYAAKSEQPLFDIYFGITGLENIYKLILKEADELNIFSSYSARENPSIDRLIKRQIYLQEKAGIKVKSIVRNTKPRTESDFAKTIKGASIQIKALDEDEFLSETQIFIWSNSIAFNTIGDAMITTVIRNPKIYSTFNMIFGVIWNRLPEIKSP